ncbi:Mss4-like protein [Schizophyllum fasciatum]
MYTGSCFCGAVRYTYSGDLASTALCHCLDCRKISGGAFSVNLGVPSDSLTVISGTPKTFACVGGSGKGVVNTFCGDCGSTLWREMELKPGVRVLKVGTLDDAGALGELRPGVELFTKRRAGWLSAMPDTVQNEAL